MKASELDRIVKACLRVPSDGTFAVEVITEVAITLEYKNVKKAIAGCIMEMKKTREEFPEHKLCEDNHATFIINDGRLAAIIF